MADQFGLPAAKPSIGTQFISGATSAINPASLGLSIASKALAGIGSALGIGAVDKNPGRIAGNFNYYKQALAGDMTGYKWLLCRSGQGQCWIKGEGSWATQYARDDAARLLNDLQSRGIGTTSGQNAGNGFALGTSPIPTNGNGAVMPLNQMGMVPTPATAGALWLYMIVGLAAVVYFRPKR